MNISKIANLKFFFTKTKNLSKFLGYLTFFLMLGGIYWGLFVAPSDYLQGESYRIMYLHVPAAWLSLAGIHDYGFCWIYITCLESENNGNY